MRQNLSQSVVGHVHFQRQNVCFRCLSDKPSHMNDFFAEFS